MAYILFLSGGPGPLQVSPPVSEIAVGLARTSVQLGRLLCTLESSTILVASSRAVIEIIIIESSGARGFVFACDRLALWRRHV